MRNLTKISISKSPQWSSREPPGDAVVRALAESCPHLESLHWEEADDLNIPFSISAETLYALLVRCKSLRFIRWLSADLGLIPMLIQCETRPDLEVFMTGSGEEFGELQNVILAVAEGSLATDHRFRGKLFVHSFANPYTLGEEVIDFIKGEAEEICAIANGTCGFHIEYELDTFG